MYEVYLHWVISDTGTVLQGYCRKVVAMIQVKSAVNCRLGQNMSFAAVGSTRRMPVVTFDAGQRMPSHTTTPNYSISSMYNIFKDCKLKSTNLAGCYHSLWSTDLHEGLVQMRFILRNARMPQFLKNQNLKFGNTKNLETIRIC
jgi:hypothetical protein